MDEEMPVENTLSCQEVVGLVTEYLENALFPEMQRQFEEHVAACSDCTKYVEQIRQTTGILHQIEREPVSPLLKQKLLQTFLNWKKGLHVNGADIG